MMKERPRCASLRTSGLRESNQQPPAERLPPPRKAGAPPFWSGLNGGRSLDAASDNGSG